jgi:hypothetical protein
MEDGMMGDGGWRIGDGGGEDLYNLEFVQEQHLLGAVGTRRVTGLVSSIEV